MNTSEEGCKARKKEGNEEEDKGGRRCRARCADRKASRDGRGGWPRERHRPGVVGSPWQGRRRRREEKPRQRRGQSSTRSGLRGSAQPVGPASWAKLSCDQRERLGETWGGGQLGKGVERTVGHGGTSGLRWWKCGWGGRSDAGAMLP